MHTSDLLGLYTSTIVATITENTYTDVIPDDLVCGDGKFSCDCSLA